MGLLVATLVGGGTLSLGGSSFGTSFDSQRKRGDGCITPFRLVFKTLLFRMAGRPIQETSEAFLPKSHTPPRSPFDLPPS